MVESTHLGLLYSCISLDTWGGGQGFKSVGAEYKQTN